MKVFKRIYKRIVRLYKWLPILWYSYDFDYKFAIEVFTLKLEEIAEFLESDKALSVDSKFYASRIRTALELFRKVYEEEYSTAYLEEIQKIYGKSVTDVKFVKVKEGYKLVWEYESWANSEEVSKKITELYKKSKQQQEKAHRLLWKFLEHNIREWWD
jgi:23S rRNA G2069 N7-methylase RlmK/C1962 C5-methylase RlmI